MRSLRNSANDPARAEQGTARDGGQLGMLVNRITSSCPTRVSAGVEAVEQLRVSR